MEKKFLEIPWIKYRFQRHHEIKPQLLSLLREQKSEPQIDTSFIHRTDWFVDCGQVRKYWEFLLPNIQSSLDDIFRELDYPDYNFINVWFQQYDKGGCHDWHHHAASSWSCVYYVELDSTAPSTVLLDPKSKTTLINTQVGEGDILVFPSIIKHCSPPNTGNRKTIVAFNIS